MFDNNNIDDIFRKGLGNYQEQPSEEVWRKVEKKLWLKRVLKLGLGIFIGLFIIGITTLILVSPDNKKQQAAQPNAKTQEQKAISQINKNQKIIQENAITTKTLSGSDNSTTNHNDEAKAKQISKTNITTISSSEKTSGTTDKKNNSSDNENKNKIAVDKTPQKAEKNIQKASQEEPLRLTLPIAEKQKEAIQPRTETNKQGVAEKTENPINAKQTEKPETTLSEIKTQVTSNEAPKASVLNENKNQTNANEAKNQTKTEIVNTQAIDNKNEINKTETSKAEKKSISPDNEHKFKIPIKPAYEILFYVMPSYAVKTLSGLTQEETDFRKVNEKAHLFLNYGMEFRYRFKNITIQAGLIQSQSGEKNNYGYQYLKGIDTTGSHVDISVVSHPDPQNTNNTIITFDSTWIKVADSSFANVKLNNTNVIKYIEIPLNIGYVFNVNKHQFGINGGISYALLTKTSVSLVNKNTNEILTISKKDNIFKNTMWSYNVALSYSYQIIGNTSVYIQTGYKKNINSVFNNSSTKQLYHFLDTKIGVMIKL